MASISINTWNKEGGQELLYRAYFYIVLDGEWSQSFSMLDMVGLPFDTPVLHLKFSGPVSCIVIQAGISRHYRYELRTSANFLVSFISVICTLWGYYDTESKRGTYFDSNASVSGQTDFYVVAKRRQAFRSTLLSQSNTQVGERNSETCLSMPLDSVFRVALRFLLLS